MIGATVIGADAVAASFLRAAATFPGRQKNVVAHYGQVYQFLVRAYASGPPGPQVITGEYRNSIKLNVRHLPGEDVAEVWTDAPQARRLEFGFVGEDSLGRYYNQRPRPHWEPPLLGTAKEMHEALGSTLSLVVAA